MAPKDIYANCVPTRSKPNFDADEQLYKEIATGFKLLPTFESTLFAKVYTRHYSLQRNEYLKCRWSQYKKHTDGSVKRGPFQLSEIRDLHFYNCAIRIRPEASIHRQDHRKKLTPGPGVDSLGHLPIPQEAILKRGTSDKHNAQKLRKNVKPKSK